MRIIHLTLFMVSIQLCVHMFTVNGVQQQEQPQAPAYRCPQMCTCSIYMGLNMANCSGEHLISANIGMPSPVEYLDISYNDITTIDNECFKDLRHLQTLLMNRNSISFIELDAFSSLTKLNTINLTYNRLESFDNRIFEQNLHLSVVDLSGNKFMHLPNAPILRSLSLEELDLKKSQLTHLHVNYFAELPNIKSIDLSENLLIVLNLAAFATNNHLQMINIAQNRIKCDEQTEMSIIWLNRNYVNVDIDNCPKKGTKTIEVPSSPPSPKFERILMMPTNNVNNTTIATPSSPPPLPPPTTLPPPSIDTPTIASTPVDLNSVWNIHNENDHNIPILNERCNANETSIEQACQFFEICIANFTMLIEEVEAKLLLKSGSGSDISSNSMGNMQYGGYNTMPFQHSWYEFVSIQVAFYGGLLLGTLLGAIILFILKLISDCVMWSSTEDSSRRIRRKRRNRQFQSSADMGNTTRDAPMITNSDNVPTSSSLSLSAAAATLSSPSYERSISRQNRRDTTTTRDLMLINNNSDNNNQRSQPRRPPSTSFFAIFYERPVRHRYYRQINRSATNLVRRLSQSRLFLNSSRAQNAAYRSNFTRQSSRCSNATTTTGAAAASAASTAADIQRHDIETQAQQPDSELAVMLDERNQIDDTTIDDNHQNGNQSCGDGDDDNIIEHRIRGGGSIHSLNMSNDCTQNMVANRLSAIRSVASENDLLNFRNDERSETPPPPYNIAVYHRKM